MDTLSKCQHKRAADESDVPLQNRVFRSKRVQIMRLFRDARDLRERQARVKRAANAYKSQLWPDGIIPYQIDSVFESK